MLIIISCNIDLSLSPLPLPRSPITPPPPLSPSPPSPTPSPTPTPFHSPRYHPLSSSLYLITLPLSLPPYLLTSLLFYLDLPVYRLSAP